MGLRIKITLLLLALVLPVVVVFSWARFSYESQERKERHAERVANNLQRRSRALCRQRVLPKRLLRRVRMTSVGTFDAASWEPRQPGDVVISQSLKEQWRQAKLRGEEVLHLPREGSGVTVVDLGQEYPEHCQVLVLAWSGKMGMKKAISKVVLQQVALLFLVLIATGVLVTFPLIRRIRQLQVHIEGASAQTGWEVPHKWRSSADELGQLARAFEQTGERLEQGVVALKRRDEALKEYISNTTHDLAIPLTVLQHRLRRLKRAIDGGKMPKVGVIDGALEESHYIASLIANMSAAAKLEAGKKHHVMHEVEMNTLVERVIARHEPIAVQKQVELNWAVPMDEMVVMGDSILLEQALSNLVQNALQYNDVGGHVAVVLEEAEQGRFVLTVMDDGPGAPESLLSKLSRRAVRSDDARNRNPGGQGFGLSIVSGVCDAHGFELRFENGEEGGFKVTISGDGRGVGEK